MKEIKIKKLFAFLMVAMTTPMSVIEVVHVAIYEPLQYEAALHAAMPLISGFGAAFLLMVFFNFLSEKFFHQFLVLKLFLPLLPGVLIGFLTVALVKSGSSVFLKALIVDNPYNVSYFNYNFIIKNFLIYLFTYK